MKAKIFLFLFALPFFGVGVWMGYSIGNNLLDAWQMREWIPVQATLQRAGYETNSGDESDTYRAFAEYGYEYGGRRYINDRVGISGGSDNIGDYQRDMGRYLSGLRSRGETITVYVNPEDPADSIIDRSVRWGLIGFKAIFFLVFGGVGLGLIIAVFRAPQEKDPEDPMLRDAPWLANDKWQTAEIRSDSKPTMWAAWAFAAFWNLISAPLPFVVYTEITQKDNWLALIGLLFPLVGIGLITWAVKRTLEWRRFGPAPLTLDPFPGSIGGHVGGTIDLNLQYDVNSDFSLTLSNLHSYVSGSGEDRSRHEDVKWQDTQLAQVSPGPRGSRLRFRFDVPHNLNQSDAEQSDDSYYLWRLNISARLPGVDVDRNYEIPVYATGRKSAGLSDSSIQHARGRQKKIDMKAIEDLVDLTYKAGGPSMHFPIGRNLGGATTAAVVGAIFAGAGWWLLRYEGHPIMGGVVGLVGILVVVAGLYAVLNSLEVMQSGDEIQSVRRILGIPVSQRRMRRSDVIRLEKHVAAKSSSGRRHTIHYSVNAIGRDGQKMKLGEGFKGASQADAAAGLFASVFGLRVQEVGQAAESPDEEYDMLAAD